jgi:serine protease Do
LPDFTEMVTRYGPAVVNISSTGRDVEEEIDAQEAPEGEPSTPDDPRLHEFFRKFFGEHGAPDEGDRPEGPASLGSGFIISKDGYVISNYHVIKGASEIVVRLSDRRELKAELIGSDPRTDLAVLKVKAEGDLPTVKLGRSEILKVGEWVLAIGSPFGFDHSVTAGIVSAKGRSLPNENYVPFIQTDVAINPGNSGGPLFNLAGEVVGVNSQIYSRTGGFMGLSFAIPIDVVMNVYQQLREKGAVSRGWLGVLIQDVTGELAESFKMETPHGALVSRVLPDSPAAKAGIKAGDVIMRFNGTDVSLSSDLPPIVGATSVGQSIPVEVLRDGKTLRLTVLIGKLPESDKEPANETRKPAAEPGLFEQRLKVHVRELNADELSSFKMKGPAVVVEKLKSGPASQAGVQAGDIIVQFNFKEIKL